MTTTYEIQKLEPGFLRFTAWYSELDRFQLYIERPDGTMEGPFAPPAGPDDVQTNFIDQIGIFHVGANMEFSGSTSDFRELLIDFTGETGTYKLLLETTQVDSDGQIYGMLNPSRFSNDNAFADTEEVGGAINAYASCFSTISPTDYVATSNWVDIDGIPRMRVGEGDPGEIWKGSSFGPTMDGRYGVDVAAPGEIAAAAYSLDSYYGSFSFNVLENSEGYYGIQTAVSAASPIVTGVIALMLEVDPALTPDEIKDILQASARTDSFTGTTPNEIWGYGKLDALAAIEATFLTLHTTPKDFTSQIEVFPNPTFEEIYIKQIQPTADAHYRLLNTAGQLLQEGSLGINITINLEKYQPGLYYLEIISEGAVFTQKVVKM